VSVLSSFKVVTRILVEYSLDSIQRRLSSATITSGPVREWPLRWPSSVGELAAGRSGWRCRAAQTGHARTATGPLRATRKRPLASLRGSAADREAF